MENAVSAQQQFSSISFAPGQVKQHERKVMSMMSDKRELTEKLEGIVKFLENASAMPQSYFDKLVDSEIMHEIIKNSNETFSKCQIFQFFKTTCLSDKRVDFTEAQKNDLRENSFFEPFKKITLQLEHFLKVTPKDKVPEDIKEYIQRLVISMREHELQTYQSFVILDGHQFSKADLKKHILNMFKEPESFGYNINWEHENPINKKLIEILVHDINKAKELEAIPTFTTSSELKLVIEAIRPTTETLLNITNLNKKGALKNNGQNGKFTYRMFIEAIDSNLDKYYRNKELEINQSAMLQLIFDEIRKLLGAEIVQGKSLNHDFHGPVDSHIISFNDDPDVKYTILIKSSNDPEEDLSESVPTDFYESLCYLNLSNGTCQKYNAIKVWKNFKNYIRAFVFATKTYLSESIFLGLDVNAVILAMSSVFKVIFFDIVAGNDQNARNMLKLCRVSETLLKISDLLFIIEIKENGAPPNNLWDSYIKHTEKYLDAKVLDSDYKLIADGLCRVILDDNNCCKPKLDTYVHSKAFAETIITKCGETPPEVFRKDLAEVLRTNGIISYKFLRSGENFYENLKANYQYVRE